MTEDRPPEEPPDDDRGLLSEIPVALRWMPVVLVVGAVALWEFLAPDTFRGEEGAWGEMGYLLGLGLVVAGLVVVTMLLRRNRDD